MTPPQLITLEYDSAYSTKLSLKRHRIFIKHIPYHYINTPQVTNSRQKMKPLEESREHLLCSYHEHIKSIIY